MWMQSLNALYKESFLEVKIALVCVGQVLLTVSVGCSGDRTVWGGGGGGGGGGGRGWGGMEWDISTSQFAVNV